MAELSAKYGADQLKCDLIPGSGGVFDVVIDGKLVYSKKQAGKFPGYGEIPLLIDRMIVES